GDTEFTHEIRVLAIRLLDASPTGIARDIDYRRKRQLHTTCANLSGDDGEYACQQLRIPGARESERLRKVSSAPSRVPMEPFLVKQRRNRQAGLRHLVVLHGID